MIHWHGIRLPNTMDGVNVLTQDAVIPGGSFDYRFAVPDAGTFWYHSHYLSLDQVSRGMFGPLIVEERNPPDVDQDITIQLLDILTDAEGNFDRAFHPAHYTTEGRLGDVMTAFSSSSQTRVGERLRLRLINPSVDRVFKIALQGLSGVVVALDGMPLAEPQLSSPLNSSIDFCFL
jgi:FtsP/CotA-like multicopper oxidase with cupredoxin domain